LGISVDLPAGETQSVVINAPAGDYEYYCNIPGHKEAGMVGVLHVVEGATLPGTDASSAASDSSSSDSGAAGTAAAGSDATGETVSIKAEDIFFDPADITIPADTDVTIDLTNEGAAPHNFAIDALNVSVDLPPGAKESVVINAPAGEYEYYCNVPGHKEAGMVGKLIVK
jgi:uncharacterized cupredoxin-like copper-binding protein